MENDKQETSSSFPQNLRAPHQVIQEQYSHLPVPSPFPSLTKSLIYIDLKEVGRINRQLSTLKETKAQRSGNCTRLQITAAAGGPEPRDPDGAQCLVEYSILTQNYHILLKHYQNSTQQVRKSKKELYVHSNFLNLNNQDYILRGAGRE